MTLIDYLSTRYQYGRGENGARTIRRKTAAAVGIFGKGRATSEDPFKLLSASLGPIHAECIEQCGPCSRAQVVKAAHNAAEMQEIAEYRDRKNNR